MNQDLRRLAAMALFAGFAFALVVGCDKKDTPQTKEATGGNASSGEGKSDRDAIQGKWVPTSVSVWGHPMTDSDMEMKQTISFNAGSCEWMVSGTYVLSPDARPKVIELYTTGAGFRQTIRMIYELNGDELKMGIKDGAAGEGVESDPGNRWSATRPSTQKVSGPPASYMSDDLMPGPGKKIFIFHRAG